MRAASFKADQADAKQVEALVKSVAKEFGRLDILVNNAGVFAAGAINDPTADRAALEREFAVNVGGVVAAVRAAVQFMGEGGRIITIGSVAGDTTPWAGAAVIRRRRPQSAPIRAAGRQTSAPRASP